MKPITEQDSVNFHVITKGRFVPFQKENCARPISKNVRKEYANQTRYKTAKDVYLSTFRRMKSGTMLHGNVEARSTSQLRKIRSEGNLQSTPKLSPTESALQQLEARFKMESRFCDEKLKHLNGFIKHTKDSPYSIMMFCPEQVRIAGMVDDLYIDATGQMIPRKNEKQVLLHSIVGKLKNLDDVPVVPLAEMLATSGSALEVEFMIRHFADEVKKVNPTWKPRMVVSDFSLAYLHANSQAFCEMPLHMYINMKYDHMISPEDAQSYQGPIIFGCSAHFLHFLRRYMDRKTQNKPAVQAGMHAFAKLIETTTKDDYQRIISDSISLFGLQNLDPKVKEKIVANMVSSGPAYDNDEFLQEFRNTIKSDIEMRDINPNVDARLKRQRSKYYVYFEELKKEILSEATNPSQVANEYCDKTVLETLSRWNVYYPIWSKMAFLSKPPIPVRTITTGVAERYFGELKHSSHPKRNIRDDIFITKHAEVVTTMMASAQATSYLTPKKLPRTMEKKRTTIDKPNLETNNNTTDESVVQLDPTLSPVNQINDESRQTNNSGDIQSRRKIVKNKDTEIGISKSTGSISSSAYAVSKWSHGKKRSKPKYIKSVINAAADTARNSSKPYKIHSGTAKKSDDRIPDKTPNLLGYPEEEIVKTVKILTSVDNTNDGFELNKREWVVESRVIENMITPPDVVPVAGNETDILTLTNGTLVSSSVAFRMASKILEDVKPPGKNFILHPTAVFPTGNNITTDRSVFPTLAENELLETKFYMVSMLANHAWLTVVDIPRRTIEYYDSLPSAVRKYTRTQYFKTLQTSIKEVYNIPQQFAIEQKPTARQVGCECVQMSLLALKNILQNSDPKDIVAATAFQYREVIARELLSETDIGRHILKLSKGNGERALKLLADRQAERKTVGEFYQRRNEVSEMYRKHMRRNKVNRMVGTEWTQILEKTAALKADIERHEHELIARPFTFNSAIVSTIRHERCCHSFIVFICGSFLLLGEL